MAGVPGFEPGNDGIKTRCLTAWRYPNWKTLHKDGWGARIRTWVWWNQNPLPYRLATPQNGGYDGIRTCDPRIMSAML